MDSYTDWKADMLQSCKYSKTAPISEYSGNSENTKTAKIAKIAKTVQNSATYRYSARDLPRTYTFAVV